jgi:hypothetical protein
MTARQARALTRIVPEALLWTVLVPALDAYDWLYLCYRRPQPVGPVLCVDRRVYRGVARRFPDGTLLRPGDPIGELHLRNRRVRAIHATVGHPVPLGLTFRRLLVASLRALADATEADPLLRPLKAFHASTILATGAERIGFVVTAADGRARRLRTLFFHLLLCRYHAHGLARLPEAGLPPRELWLTAAELRRRYGGAAAANAGLTPGSVRALPRGRP